MMSANDQCGTQSLGYAVSNQITDVVDAVQRVRYQAKQAGNLDSDSKINVIEEGTNIRIESTDPQVIYVPTYDTTTMYHAGLVLGYSAAIATNVLLWQNVFTLERRLLLPSALRLDSARISTTGPTAGARPATTVPPTSIGPTATTLTTAVSTTSTPTSMSPATTSTR